MPARPPYRSTLQNLAAGLTAGMNPMVALQQLASVQDERQMYMDQLEAEREEKQAEKQQRFATLADMVFQNAASGMPVGATEQQAEFLTGAMPGMGPRMTGRLEDLIGSAYPTQPGSFQDISPSVAAKGTLEEIAGAQEAQGRPMQISPMYVPPVPEMGTTEMPNLAEIDVQTGTDQITDKPITGPLGPVLSQTAQQDKMDGRSLEESIDGAQRFAIRQGIMDPAVLEAIAQQVTVLWGTFPGPPNQGGQPQPQSAPGVGETQLFGQGLPSPNAPSITVRPPGGGLRRRPVNPTNPWGI